MITDSPELLEELSAMMGKQYQPFLSEAQAFRVNTHRLKTCVLDQLNEWFEWLPETTMNQLGGELAMAALQEVDWSDIALQVRLAPLLREERQPCK